MSTFAVMALPVFVAGPLGGAEDPVLRVRDFLGPGISFGFRAAAADVDRDGIKDVAIGAPRDDAEGVVWLLFLTAEGIVREFTKLGAVAAGFQGTLHAGDAFGSGVAFLGDLDGDGGEDLAVGASGDSLGGEGRGAVWLLFLDAGGKLKKQARIGSGAGGFTGALDDGDAFGRAVTAPGDLDGDGNADIIVWAANDDDGGENQGALWVLFLDQDGTVKGQRKISATEGGFEGAIDAEDGFGSGLGAVGDLDEDGVEDIAVGAPGDDDGGNQRGAVWILFLKADGTVKAHQKISSTSGGLSGPLETLDRFGIAAQGLGDIDGDGALDLAVGSRVRESPPEDPEGAVWILFLDRTGKVKDQERIERTGSFGSSLAALGDLDGDGVEDFASGIPSGSSCDGEGALTVVLLNADGTKKGERLTCASALGSRANRVAAAGDIDGNGTRDLILSESNELWLLLLAPGERVKELRKLYPGGTFTGDADPDDEFGFAATGLGDLDGDGAGDIAVAAPGDDDGGEDFGAVWILFLRADGTVKSDQKVSATVGGFAGPIGADDDFATSLAGLGDLDGDGVEDLAVGARRDAGGGENRGAVWILFLKADGTVKGRTKIGEGAGITLADGDLFGAGLAGLGDIDADGAVDLAVGAPGKEVPGITNAGAVWVLLLGKDGAVRSALEVTYAGEDPNGSPRFGESLALLDDLDGNSVADLAAGAPGLDPGAAFLLLLANDGHVASQCQVNDQVMAEPTVFGASLAGIGDWDGDGSPDLVIEKDVVIDDEPDLHMIQFFFLDLDASASGDQLPNDCNQDGKLNVSDAICLLGHLFQGHPSELPCAGGTAGDRGNVSLLDCDGNERVDLTDAICVLGWLFRGGPEPHGGTECGRIAGCPSACRA